MKAIMVWISAMVNNVRNWWNTHRTDIARARRDFWRGFDRLSRNITRLIVIGVLVNIVASLYPEFPERFPVIYGWFDGWLQFGEFLFKVALGSLYAIFTGNFGEFWVEYGEALKELAHQFTNWMATIHF